MAAVRRASAVMRRSAKRPGAPSGPDRRCTVTGPRLLRNVPSAHVRVGCGPLPVEDALAHPVGSLSPPLHGEPDLAHGVVVDQQGEVRWPGPPARPQEARACPRGPHDVRGAGEEAPAVDETRLLPSGDDRPGAAVAQRPTVAEQPADDVGADGVLVGDPAEHVQVPLRDLHAAWLAVGNPAFLDGRALVRLRRPRRRTLLRLVSSALFSTI